MIKNDKKVIRAWCSYDVANSVYNLIITSVLFPIYYNESTKKAFGSTLVEFAGIELRNSVLYDFTIATAYFTIIVLSPVLSGMADYAGIRKRFMQFFTFLGAGACFSLYWFNGHNLGYGMTLVALAVIGYAGSLVYYNSFLPIIATPDRHDRISAKGFSWGYIGSMILLIISLLIIENYQRLGFAFKLDAVRFSFLMVGVWWISVSQLAFWILKDYPSDNPLNLKVLTRGHREILNVFDRLRHTPVLKRFLFAFFFWSMGVQTVMLVASLFGSNELHIEGSKLIMTILLIQLLGIMGSFLFAEVSSRFGNKLSIAIMLVIWIGICVWAFFIRTEMQFFTIAAFVGLVMGGIQSQSRSTYSKMIPEGTTDTASYFSFYDITEKAAIVLGMLSFGFIEHLTGNMRTSALVLSLYFLTGLVVLLSVKFSRQS